MQQTENVTPFSIIDIHISSNISSCKHVLFDSFLSRPSLSTTCSFHATCGPSCGAPRRRTEPTGGSPTASSGGLLMTCLAAPHFKPQAPCARLPVPSRLVAHLEERETWCVKGCDDSGEKEMSRELYSMTDALIQCSATHPVAVADKPKTMRDTRYHGPRRVAGDLSATLAGK